MRSSSVRTFGFLTTVALAVACFAAILASASVFFVEPIAIVLLRLTRFHVLRNLWGPAENRQLYPGCGTCHHPPVRNGCRCPPDARFPPYNRAKTRRLHDFSSPRYPPHPSHRPPGRLAPSSARWRRDGCGRRRDSARLRASNRHAQSASTCDDHEDGANLPRAHRRRAAFGLALPAAHDDLSHRQYDR